MHLECRERNGLKKYYLAHSFRVGGNVRKVRVYLGADLSSEDLKLKRKRAEAELKERPKKKQAIRDPFITVLSPSDLKELETLEARGELQVLHLSDLDWERLKEAFTYDTKEM